MLFTACIPAWAAGHTDLPMLERKINLAQAKGEMSAHQIIVFKRQVQTLQQKAKQHQNVDREVTALNEQLDKATKRNQATASRPKIFGIF